MFFRAVILFFCLVSSLPKCNGQVVYWVEAVGQTVPRVDDHVWFTKSCLGTVGIMGFRSAPDWNPQTEIYAGPRMFTFPVSVYAFLFAFIAMVVSAVLVWGKSKRQSEFGEI